MTINSVCTTASLPIISNATLSYSEDIIGELPDYFKDPICPPLSEFSYSDPNPPLSEFSYDLPEFLSTTTLPTLDSSSSSTSELSYAFPDFPSPTTLPTLDSSSSSMLDPELASPLSAEQVVPSSYPFSVSSTLSSTISYVSSSNMFQKPMQENELYSSINSYSFSSCISSSSGSSVPIQCKYDNIFRTPAKQQRVIPAFNELRSRGSRMVSNSVSSQSSCSVSSGTGCKKRKIIEIQEKSFQDEAIDCLHLTEKRMSTIRDEVYQIDKTIEDLKQQRRIKSREDDTLSYTAVTLMSTAELPSIEKLKLQRRLKSREYDSLSDTAVILMSTAELPYLAPIPLPTPGEIFIQNFELLTSKTLPTN